MESIDERDFTGSVSMITLFLEAMVGYVVQVLLGNMRSQEREEDLRTNHCLSMLK